MKKVHHKHIIRFAKDLVKYCKKTNFDFDEDHIHQFRIRFKKLRAILRLQKKSKILGSDIKNIYNLAGEIRSVQLAIKMLSSEGVGSLESGVWSPESEVTNKLLLNLEPLKKEWKAGYHKKMLTGFLSDLKKLKVNPVSHTGFLNKKINKLFYLVFADTITDSMLHEVRKIAKDLQYAMEVCKCDDIHSKLYDKPISVKTLKTIGKEIGPYNDLCMLIIFLTKFKPPKDDPDLLNKVYPLIAKKLLDKSKLKKILILILQSIIKSS